MNAATRSNPFPALHLAICITLTAAVIIPLQITFLPKFDLSSDPGVIFKTSLFMGVITWYGFMMGILPMMMLAQRGPLGLVWGFFSGTMTHVMVCVVSAGLLITLGRMPSQVVALSLICGYLPLLAVQVYVLRRFMANGTPPVLSTPTGKPGSTEVIS